MFTSKSHDQGADIIGIPPNKKEAVVIQCKHTGSNVVNSKGVDDLRRACDFYETSKGILVTNAHLSRGGRERLDELNMHYKLIEWNFSKLLSLGSGIMETSFAKKSPRPYQQRAIYSISMQ